MQSRPGADMPSYANLEDRVIRVFISSTFSDMGAERDVLVKSVFPRLAAVAAKRDVTVVPLDLRWGITDDMARSGRVIETCLNEIVHSRPFFLGLVGNRYGSCLAAEEVGKNRGLLERYSWLERDMLDGRSITEIEIQYGVLSNPDEIDAFFYIREGGDPSSCDNPEKLSLLKQSIRDNGRYPVDSYASAEELGAKVEAAFLRVLDSHFPDEPQTELMRERRSQRAFLRSRLSAYIRNDEAHDALDRFMAGDDRNFVITGPSGMGKSALLANWLEEHRGDIGRRTIYHFVGNGGLEGDYRSIARRLCDEVRDLYGLPQLSGAQAKGDKKPWEELSSLYAEISGREPLLVVLDGINQLHDEDNAKLLLWLAVPGRNVKYIFSTLDDDRTMEVFRSRGYEEYTLQPLSAARRTKLVADYLMLYGKRLTDSQVERIVGDPQSQNTLVLRVLLDELVSFSSHERLDGHIDYYLSADSIDEFFRRVLRRIEDDLGEATVRRLLSLITFSQAGLSETELMALSGLDSYRWSLFLAHFRGYLTVKGGLLTFSHRYMTQACLTKYAAEEHDTRLLIAERFAANDTPRAWSELAYQYFMLYDCPRLYRHLLRLDVFDLLYKKDEYQLGRYWQLLLNTDEERFTPDEYLNAPGVADASRADYFNNLSLFFSQIVVRLELSLSLAQASLSIRKEISGENNSDTAMAYNNIGGAYDALGDYDRSLDYHNKALTIQQRVLGDGHPDTADSYNNIGAAYSYMGEYVKALECYDNALAIYQKAFGYKHADTARCYNNIGAAYDSLGQYDEAHEYHNKSLAIRQEVLGEDHPETADSYNNIGDTYRLLGRHDKALEYHNKSLVIRQKVLGNKHPDTAVSYNGIGGAYFYMGEYGTALEYYNKALIIRQKVLGEEHPDTATSYSNIGNIYTVLGDYDKALEYYGKALTIRQKVLGEEHPDTALSYNNIGLVYCKLDDYDKSLEYYNKALTIKQKILGEEHPDTAISYNDIGLVYADLGEYSLALEYFNKSLAIRQELLGEEHPFTATSFNNIGYVYNALGEYEKALEYFNKSLSIRQKVLGEEHPDTAMSYNNMGSVYADLGDYDKSLEYYNKALSIRQKVLGEEHPDTAMSYNNMGSVYDDLGDYDKALEYYDKALSIRQKVLGEEHPDTATSYNNIGYVYSELGDYDKSLEYYDKALSIYRKVLGNEHPDTIKVRDNINQAREKMQSSKKG